MATSFSGPDDFFAAGLGLGLHFAVGLAFALGWGDRTYQCGEAVRPPLQHKLLAIMILTCTELRHLKKLNYQ